MSGVGPDWIKVEEHPEGTVWEQPDGMLMFVSRREQIVLRRRDAIGCGLLPPPAALAETGETG
jgi:hypothetical protein